ncbi:hypothetical protein BaRGS_00031037 [Batillaria attramentaria]|uniref:Uncharacterized protein n=1 Tax=Batillaria attramentaria TaxID=370345 RepID=A0ABD0JSX0_9CAEN
MWSGTSEDATQKLPVTSFSGSESLRRWLFSTPAGIPPQFRPPPPSSKRQIARDGLKPARLLGAERFLCHLDPGM